MTPKTKEPKVVLVDPYRGGIPGLGLGYLAAYLREKNRLSQIKILQRNFYPSLGEAIIKEEMGHIRILSRELVGLKK